METFAASLLILTAALCALAIASYRRIQSLAERIELIENRQAPASQATDGIQGKLDTLLEKLEAAERHLLAAMQGPASAVGATAIPKPIQEEDRLPQARPDTAANPTLERRREILKLSKAGYTATQIASFLQLPASEVELLLKVLQVTASDCVPARSADGQPSAPAVRARSVAF